MNWNEYKTLAIRTESIPQNTFGALTAEKCNSLPEWEAMQRATRILHAALGLCTESNEQASGNGAINFVEETGDVLWYLAILDDELNWANDITTEPFKPSGDGNFYIGEIQDVVKRHIFYGTTLDIERIRTSAFHIFMILGNQLENERFSMEMAMEANIRKLEKRFPEKMFTAQAAIHRDVDRELDHIMLNGELIPRVETLLELETDEQLAEVVKERQGQPTVSVNLDDLVFPANVALDDAEWASIVNSNLSSAQLTSMAMALCTDKVAQLRKAGANLEAKAYDALYVMVGSSNSLLLDNSLYHMWESLGYSVKKADVVERLERWK